MEPYRNHQDGPNRQSQDLDGHLLPLKNVGDPIIPALSKEGHSPVLAMESEKKLNAPTVGQCPVSEYPPQWTPADEHQARQASQGPGSNPPLRANLPSNGGTEQDYWAMQNEEAVRRLEAADQEARARLERYLNIDNIHTNGNFAQPGFGTPTPHSNLADTLSVNRNLVETGPIRQHPQLPQGQGTRVVGPPPGLGYNTGRPMTHNPNQVSMVGPPRPPIPHEQAASPYTNALTRPSIPPGRASPRYTNAPVVAVRAPLPLPLHSLVPGFRNGFGRSSRPPHPQPSARHRTPPGQQGEPNGLPFQLPMAHQPLPPGQQGEPNGSPFQLPMVHQPLPPGQQGEPNGSPFQQPMVHQRPASHASPAPAPQKGLEWRGAPNGPPNGISRFYKGNRMLPNNMSANIADSENCSLWMTNLPRDCNERMLLGAVRGCGKVYQTVINSPQGEHHTGCAAKLIFFHHNEAARLLRRSREGMFHVGDRQPNVTHNRTRVASKPASKESRVLQITGPREIVNHEYLTGLFRSVCKYQLEVVEDRGPVGGGLDSRHEMIWRFGSVRCQAHWCHRELHEQRRRHRLRDVGHCGDDAGQTSMGQMGRLWNAVEIHYGVDPCDVNPGV